MCEKCNRLTAAIQYEAKHIGYRKGIVAEKRDLESRIEYQILDCIEDALLGILDNLKMGRGL